MTRRISRALVAAVGLALVSACTDVSVAPKSTISSANIFNEPSSYRAFLAKIYGGLALTGQEGPAGRPDIQGIDEGFSHYLRLLWQLQELPTDEAALAWNDDGIQPLNTQTWSSNNPFLVSMYYRIFFQVSLVNQFLRETTDEKLTSRNVSSQLRADIATYRAEARFLRALSYWHGVDLFGNIPLVTEADAVGKTPPQQATRAQVFDYIVSELNEIRDELPAGGAGPYGRADQGAVSMLLAKLYLNSEIYSGTERYAEARTEVERVIGAAYSLDNNYRRMFSADNHTSPELIFVVPQDGLRTQSFGGMTFLIHAAVGGNMNASTYGLDGGWWGLRLKPDAAALFPNNGGPTSPDKRSSFFFYDGQTLAMPSLTNFNNGVANPKFVNVTSTGGAPQNPAYADTDYPMFRLGDAYLMYAEAVLRGGGGTRALALGYVNALRQRAYGDASHNITDPELTLDFIRDERLRELLWEGHRRTDLVRFGRFTTAGVWAWKGGTAAGATTEAFKDLYPLPSNELLANPNLRQNTGY